jgi:hypothetical protein
MSFIGVIVALSIVGFLLAVCIWILYYHYRNRRLGLTNQPFLPPLPGFFRRKNKAGSAGRGLDLEGGSRPYEGLGGDEAWDTREDYDGTTRPLHSGRGARGFDGQEERGRYDDVDDVGLENPFGDDSRSVESKKTAENPFGSGAKRVEESDGSNPVSGSSRRSLFNEEI